MGHGFYFRLHSRMVTGVGFGCPQNSQPVLTKEEVRQKFIWRLCATWWQMRLFVRSWTRVCSLELTAVNCRAFRSNAMTCPRSSAWKTDKNWTESKSQCSCSWHISLPWDTRCISVWGLFWRRPAPWHHVPLAVVTVAVSCVEASTWSRMVPSARYVYIKIVDQVHGDKAKLRFSDMWSCCELRHCLTYLDMFACLLMFTNFFLHTPVYTCTIMYILYCRQVWWNVPLLKHRPVLVLAALNSQEKNDTHPFTPSIEKINKNT